MTYAEIDSIVGTLATATSLSYAYHSFREGTGEIVAPPFLTYDLGRDDFQADDVNFAKVAEVELNLYTDMEAAYSVTQYYQTAVEDYLDSLGISYEEDITPIDSERMYQTTYAFSVPLSTETEES